MKVTAVAVPVLAGIASANPVDVEARQSCPEVHVFGARETTAPPGYGTSQGLVNMVVQAYPGATSEAINYPACGGQASCGGIDASDPETAPDCKSSASYNSSANQGTQAVVSAVTSFNQRCPDTKIVLIGYSQGGQIMDNAYCGGAGATLSGSALDALSYDVGTCQAGGFAARPPGFQCSPGNPDNIKSYCDAQDPYCCNGNDTNHHQQYVTIYGQQALAFIKSKLDAA
ncbi:carbohydrate esterase family 5 protein [Thermothelomyces heterothallicus CBS 202.75]|uniref:carbohydrate esterase family 5 protein n=1 Tax=Thermothelomyces heterothallicus CBS 202.75 TaxID=1149848 RepID=UPI003742F2D9